MGSGALAGCAFPIDRWPSLANSAFLALPPTASMPSASATSPSISSLLFPTIATHLSRLAEDFVIFSSQPFSYVILPDEFSTGSSLMPQKKNPDSWELIRGKTGRVTSSLFTLLTVLKGLPTSYQRDLQEDKESLFLAHDQVQSYALRRRRRFALPLNSAKIASELCSRSCTARHGSRRLSCSGGHSFSRSARSGRQTHARSRHPWRSLDKTFSC